MDYVVTEPAARLSNLCEALRANDLRFKVGEIDTIVLELSGARGGPEWHWILLLTDGAYAYVAGGYVYEYWCGTDDVRWHQTSTMDEALQLVPSIIRPIFQKMRAMREPMRTALLPGVPYPQVRANELILRHLTLSEHFMKPDYSPHQTIREADVQIDLEPEEVQREFRRLLDISGLRVESTS